MVLAAVTLSAQETEKTSNWKSVGMAGLNLNQSTFLNWSAGGDPGIAFDASFNYSLDYKKDNHIWTNRLELAYGLNETRAKGTQKTNDKIYFASNYGCNIAKNLYASVLVSFNTQFDKGYDYEKDPENYISTFMAPGYLSGGLGLTWNALKWLTVTYAPASWRGTFVIDKKLSDAGAFGVKAGERLLNEFGSNLKIEVKTPVWHNITLYSRLEFYSNYLHNPQNIDIKWDTMINLKINKWLSANLNVNLIYDDDTKFLQDDERMIPKFQLKEVLGVGIMFSF